MKKLQYQISACGYPSWLTVVTGPKGSYREEHILSFLETHLEPWTEDRQWRILGLDAFAPQMTDSVRRLAWARGYIVVIHGGGATDSTQTNDTDLHQHQRRLYTEKEIAEMLRLARLNLEMPPLLEMAPHAQDSRLDAFPGRRGAVGGVAGREMHSTIPFPPVAARPST